MVRWPGREATEEDAGDNLPDLSPDLTANTLHFDSTSRPHTLAVHHLKATQRSDDRRHRIHVTSYCHGGGRVAGFHVDERRLWEAPSVSCSTASRTGRQRALDESVHVPVSAVSCDTAGRGGGAASLTQPHQHPVAQALLQKRVHKPVPDVEHAATPTGSMKPAGMPFRPRHPSITPSLPRVPLSTIR